MGIGYENCKWCRSNKQRFGSKYCSQKCESEADAAKKAKSSTNNENSQTFNEAIAEVKEYNRLRKKQEQEEFFEKYGANNYSELVEKNIETDNKNIFLAMFLCIPFGIFGVHWFYLGNSTRGKIYLFTLGFLGFGYFFDLLYLPYLMLKFGKHKQKNGNYYITAYIIATFIFFIFASKNGEKKDVDATKSETKIEKKNK